MSNNISKISTQANLKTLNEKKNGKKTFEIENLQMLMSIHAHIQKRIAFAKIKTTQDKK